MPDTPNKRKKPALAAQPAKTSSKVNQAPPNIRDAHGRGLTGRVYRSALSALLHHQADKVPDPDAYARAVIEDMAPRDAAEEMLIAQLLFTHARVMRLSELANYQPDVHCLQIMHEYADRASNTYRRLMLALAEYRRPPRTGDTFAVVKQANIAGQQVIQNHENSEKVATNEQGFKPTPSIPGTPGNTRARTPALSVDAGGLGFPSFIRPACETVDAVHWPPDARRQGSIAPERDEAR